MKELKFKDFQKLTLGSEERNLEYKQSFEWKNKKLIDDLQARTIKAIISMANIPNGGKVIIGINEKNGSKIFDGLTDEQLSTFNDKDKI